jgi:hypothetical protein
MRPSYKQSRARSSVPIRDPLADDLIGASGPADEYPIRHAWTFVIPPPRAEQPAPKER